MTIEELLSQPEGPSLEFKRTLTDATQLARTLIAFANGKGGKLVVGVSDERREVVGVDLTQDIEEWVMNVASTNCRPIISPVIGHHIIAGKTVLVITVYPGSAKPYYLVSKRVDEGTFIRVGSTNRRADQAAIRELSRQAANIPYDRTQAHGAAVAGLDEELINAFQARRQERLGTPVEEIAPPFLLKIGAATRVNDELVPTIAGVLLFSPHPQHLPELTRALIRSARFKGRDKHLLIDQAEIEGPLPHQIEEAARFVIRNTRLGGRVEGLVRRDIHEYPLPAIRELITNAVVHRDYSLTGAAIHIAIFDDRIEITSPGHLPIGVDTTNLLEAQVSRNGVIARRMFEMGYIDEWGRGLDEVCRLLAERRLPLPRFEEPGLSFKVTIWGPGERFMREDETEYIT